MEVLNQFCAISGQTVNLNKSKLFISHNVPRVRARRLSALTGISLTNDLGKYLGVPLIHGRVTE